MAGRSRYLAERALTEIEARDDGAAAVEPDRYDR
jgi:hypothetical protein